MLKPTNLFRWLYSITLTICLPLIFLRLLWRSRKNPQYRERWLERLGIFTPTKEKGGVWLHAVSLGESLAAIPLIRAFKKQFPHIPLTITTTTPSGSERIQQMLGDEVFHVYFPYDLPWALNAFLKRIQPKLCLIMETELWPNNLWQLKKQGIPTIIINGRLSPRSIQGYQKIARITREMMDCLTLVAAQSKMDGERFVSLGLDPSRLRVTGNVKFDITAPEGLEVKALELRQQWGRDRLVFIAASTHAGEEEIILNAFLKARETLPDLFLIMVPRHPERRESVINLIKQYSLNMVLRSQAEICTTNTDLLLVDTMGEMPLFYATADVAFVGGSFVPVGGHNTLEPAFASIPVIVGPHVHNFIDITDYLTKAGALKQVQDNEALINTLLHWLTSEDSRRAAGQQGKRVVEENRGAVAKVMALITETLHA